MQDFRNLIAWQKGHHLVLHVYKVTQNFPKEEQFGITSQLRRAVVSIPTNLAEGCGRGSDKDFARFVQIAMGSASETEYLWDLCNGLSIISSDDYTQGSQQITEVKKILASLLKSLNK